MADHSAAIDHHHNSDSTDVLGFWIYILSDYMLFAGLFATFAVLHNNTFDGPGIKQLASLPYVLTYTIFLLASNFTYGLAANAAKNKSNLDRKARIGTVFN